MHFDLNEEQKMVRDTSREFAERELKGAAARAAKSGAADASKHIEKKNICF